MHSPLRGLSGIAAAAVLLALTISSIMLIHEYLNRESQVAEKRFMEQSLQAGDAESKPVTVELEGNNVVVNGIEPSMITRVLTVDEGCEPQPLSPRDTIDAEGPCSFILKGEALNAFKRGARVILLLRGGGHVVLSDTMLNETGVGQDSSISSTIIALTSDILGSREAYSLFVLDNKNLADAMRIEEPVPIEVTVRIYGLDSNVAWYWDGPQWWAKAYYNMSVIVNGEEIASKNGEIFISMKGYGTLTGTESLGPTSWIEINSNVTNLVKYYVKVNLWVELTASVQHWGDCPYPHGYAGGSIELKTLYQGELEPLSITEDQRMWTSYTSNVADKLAVYDYTKATDDGLYLYYNIPTILHVYHEVEGRCDGEGSSLTQKSVNPRITILLGELTNK